MASALVSAREEDFVEYFLFPPTGCDSSESELDALQSALNKILSHIVPLTESYIWQKDEFKLSIRPSKLKAVPSSFDDKDGLPPHLFGTTHYGDNIEDEWFIVYLLLTLTERIPGLVARVNDVDGEFLLIEAAEFLPRWAEPEKSEGRVFLYQGEVHLVSPENVQNSSVIEHIESVRRNPESTKASQSIKSAIQKRIEGYPDKMATFHHTAQACLPITVAALLEAKPSLISPAALAFCHRDPVDVKVCRVMKRFPPKPSVLRNVKLTKCLYAMLSQQKFMPDSKAGWTLPPPTDPSFGSYLLGVKIACGFEILASQVKLPSETEDNLSTDKGWQLYKQSLVKNGYFKNLLEGSREYCSLESTAQSYYLEMKNLTQPVTGRQILELLQTINIDEDRMKEEEKCLPPPDDDSWMNISSEELDSILSARFGVKNQVIDVTDDAKAMTSKLMAFLNQRSDIDGVENIESGNDDEEEDSDDSSLKPRMKNKPSSSKEKKKKNHSDFFNEDMLSDCPIQFDQEVFANELKNVLDLVVPEDNWDLESDSSGGMSSYEDEIDMIKKTSINPSKSITELKQYMDQMDKELKSTTIGQSFDNMEDGEIQDDSFSDAENFKPVNIDVNTLKNMIKSYEEQIGEPGPTSTLLGSMGLKLDTAQKPDS